MSMINIDSVDLPAPIKFKPPNFDLDSQDTNRNELGIMQRDRIRQGILKLELAWKNITSSELHTIKSAIEPASVKVTFPTEIGFVTKTMYAGDRDIEIVAFDKDYNKIRWNISFNLTEY